MKKLFFLLALAFAASFVIPSLITGNEAKAQIVTTLTPTAAKDTLTNTDTAYVYISTAGGSVTTGIPDNISRSATAFLQRNSGTASGTIRLEGSNDGTNYELIDTAYTITNSAAQVHTLPLRVDGSMLFKQYRYVFLMTGTGVVVPKVFYHRRSN